MNSEMNSTSESSLESSQSGVHSLRRLLPYAKPYTWNFVTILVLVVIFNSTSVLQPYLVKLAIDRDMDVAHPNLHGLFVISALYMGTVILGVLANYAQILMLQFTGQSIIRTIRLDLFTHIEQQAMKFFDKNAIGRLVTNVSSDTETVSQFFTQFFLSVIRDGLSIAMIVFAMFELDVRVATYAMVIIPIVFAISLSFRSRLRRAYQTTRSRLSSIVAFLAENLAGVRIIQIFHQERRQADAFDELNRSHRRANVTEYGTSVMFNRTLEMTGNLAVAAMVFVGGQVVLHHGMLFGTLYAFITYIRQFFGPINSITQQWNTLQSSMVSAERIGTVLNVVPDIQDPVSPVQATDPEAFSGRVEFQNVDFAYKEDEPVLRGINLTIEPGMFVGFVGPTGAGKSSIMSLLTRFYDPVSGRILLDGHDIGTFKQQDLHRLIGLVQQEVNLFSGTIADNIRLFRDEISDDEVENAAVTVGADKVIERLPDGYQTHLYAKGSNLSMGERQLIAFARIVALNPRVIILDEATANLDSQTEEWVQAGLLAIAESRTTLVIAHRLSTIRGADQIVVLNRGQIVERGTHRELLNLGGQYANLHAKSGVEDVRKEPLVSTARS